jgi:phosphatidylglycerol:prolipoprotein diacylglycerol transferase
MLYVRKRNIPFLKICDAASPSLLIGYGVARLGCHLSGDGDYGLPTDLPWGTVYSNGTYPPSIAFRNFPEIVQKYGVNGVVPDTLRVHPTPVYEFLAGVLLFIILWNLRKKLAVDGTVFMVYLIMSGTARFLVEFIRLNPRILFGLSEAQLISIVIVAVGVTGLWVLSRKKDQGLSPG